MFVRFSEWLAGFKKVEKAVREMLCLLDYAERFRTEGMTQVMLRDYGKTKQYIRNIQDWEEEDSVLAENATESDLWCELSLNVQIPKFIPAVTGQPMTVSGKKKTS